MSIPEQQDSSGETEGVVGQVEADMGLPVSDERTSEVEGEGSSLANKEDEESCGVGSHLNEKRKG